MNVVSFAKKMRSINRNTMICRRYKNLNPDIQPPVPVGCDDTNIIAAISDPLTVIKGYLQLFEKTTPGNSHVWLVDVFRELDQIEQLVKNYRPASKQNSRLSDA